MMRILCLTILVFLAAFPAWADKGKTIEIYAKGKRYVSFEAYKSHQVNLQEIADNPKEKQEIEAAAKDLGVEVDPNKIKTFEVLKAAGADKGLAEVIEDFKQKAKNPQEQAVSTEVLEEKIREAVGDKKDPLLVISNDGKMRVMALTPKDLPQAQ